MKQLLLVFALLMLLAMPAMTQTETRSQCIRRLDQEVLVQTDEEIEAWLDRIVEECPPPPPVAQEATETEAVEDEEEDTEQPDPATLVACYAGDSAYVNGFINVRSGPGTTFDKVDAVQNDTVSVIGSARGAEYCWLQIGEDRWIARLSQVLSSKPIATPPPAQAASEPAADDPPPQQAPQQSGSESYFFEGQGSARSSSTIHLPRGKWHWRIRSSGSVEAFIEQDRDGSCLSWQGVNRSAARAYATSEGAWSFEVRYPCDVNITLFPNPSDGTWKIWLDKVENL